MPPIRILMISKACVVGIYQRKLEEIAAHSDIDLTVMVPPYWDDVRGRLSLERAHTRGYRLVVEPVRFNGNFHLHYYPGLRRQIEAVQPDIIHIDEEPYNLATYQAVRLARRAGARTLFFSWQNILRRYPPPFSWLERWVLAHVDAGIIGNREAEDVWRPKDFTGPLAVIPQFGVDPAIFSPRSSRPQRDHFVIGYAGRLVEEKGLDTLIRAVVRLPRKWMLRLLGNGPQREELRKLAGIHNIGGAVEIDPPVASGAMPDWYRSIDVLVLPSRTRPNWKEQFGRVLIEAMACGVPVVGSDSGAIPEVIGPAGLIFPEGDDQALAAHLLRLIDDAAIYEALAQAGRQRVQNHFTQAQIAVRTVEMYRALMDGKPPSF
jgi:glycosyltransferase involved in cell wall biosynthesis